MVLAFLWCPLCGIIYMQRNSKKKQECKQWDYHCCFYNDCVRVFDFVVLTIIEDLFRPTLPDFPPNKTPPSILSRPNIRYCYIVAVLPPIL